MVHSPLKSLGRDRNAAAPLKISGVIAAVGLFFLGASACESGRGQVPLVHRIDGPSTTNETVDGGVPALEGGVEADSAPPEATTAEDEQQAPRIPIPQLDGEPKVKVSIFRGKRSVVLKGKGLELNGAPTEGSLEIRFSAKALTHDGETVPDGSRVTADGEISFRGLGKFPGSLIFLHNETHLLIVNEVPLERYIQTVVQSEVPAVWSPEVLKAQAVAARSYALARMAFQGSQYSLESSVMDQVYRPRPLVKGVVEAVRATRGEVLVSGNSLVEAKYHSTCGGRTENPNVLWPELDMPHQWSVACEFCSASPYYRWSLFLSSAELRRRLGKVQSGVKRVERIEVKQRSESHRVLKLEVHTDAGSFELTGQSFRRAISLREVKSTAFAIQPRRGGILLKGRGFGHGAGMCQWGAAGMAEAGRGYVKILKHYYRDATLHSLYQ